MLELIKKKISINGSEINENKNINPNNSTLNN